MNNKCIYCGKEFIPLKKGDKRIKKYCSTLCRLRNNGKKYKEKNRDAEKKRCHEWYLSNKEHHKETMKRYTKEHYERHCIRKFAYDCYKERLLKKYKNKCVDCGSENKLQIHHLSYTNNINSCIILCRDCHVKRHVGSPHILSRPMPRGKDTYPIQFRVIN